MKELHLSQQEIYFDQLLNPNSPQYNIGTYVVIKGNLNTDLFKESIISSRKVFDVFNYKVFSNSVPAVILEESFSSIKVNELDFSSKDWSEDLIKVFLKERINKPFDIHSERLYDFVLIKIRENEHWFYVGCHHLFSDGYGIPYVLLAYIFDKYHALRTGQESEFNYPSYLELTERSNSYFGSKNYETDKNYWKNRFAKSQEPIFNKRSKATSFRTDSVQLRFSQSEQKKLRSFCSENEISLQDFLIAILTIYYKKANNVDFFDFNLPIHNRSDRKERRTLGVFTKLIPCRIELNNSKLSELFKAIKTNQRQDYRHKQFPASHFSRMIQIDGNSSRPFDVCVNYRYFKLETAETELELRGVKNDSAFSKTPIEYSWSDFAEKGNESLFLEIIFREDYFSKSEIELQGKRVLFIIDQFYNSINKNIEDYDIIPNEEKQNLLINFNDTEVVYPKDKTIIDLFEEQVAKIPHNIAVVFEDRNLSYKQLNEQSNHLAYFLQKKYDIKQGNLIGIKQERSEWMIISILAVLKCGGVYVPIDSEYPKERVDYIISDSGCNIVIDDILINEIKGFDRNELVKINISAHGANTHCAVIYTSGSTGKPKGVVISNANLLNRLYWMWSEFPFVAEEVCAAKTSIGFVDHLWEIFGPLLKGIRLVIFSKEMVLDTIKFIHQLSEKRVSRIILVPSLLRQILSHEKLCIDKLKYLKEWSCSGEALDFQLVDSFHSIFKTHRLLNIYGSTEVTADATYYDTSPAFKINAQPSLIPALFDEFIGKDLNNNLIDSDRAKGIINPFDDKKKEFLKDVSLGKKGVEKYANFIKDTLLNGIVNVSDPKFIGHMTGPPPPLMIELNKLMVTWNQNLVKFETSGIGTLLERQCIGMLHNLVYKKGDSFYEEFLQNASFSLGVVTSGGTLSNFTALSYALSKALMQKSNFEGLNKKGLKAALKAYSYSGIFIIGSQRCHYSFGKTLKALGLGEDAFIPFEMDKNDLEKSSEELINLISEKQAKGNLILAIIGVAGSTESGNIDPLNTLSKIASRFNIHFHVDAAFGGGYLFSEKLAHKLDGIQYCDSVTICGHKQLYLPLGLSVCLFKSESLALHSENTSKYQARKNSLDLGRYTIDGSRPFLSFVLHGALNIIGKEGYAEIMESNYERALVFKSLIRLNRSFELIESSDLNIVLYRYIPSSMRDIGSLRPFTEAELLKINELNKQIQKRQFEFGRSFVSYTELKDDNSELSLVALRAVLMNPYTTKKHIEEILDEQEEIAFDLQGLSRTEKKTVKDERMVCVGRPISNTSIYILNDYHQLVPEGITGEICIGGKCLSEGYLNNPELTKEKFILNPFIPNERLYKTGDLGRWTKEGNVEFMGRKDNQVKIRGYRIELGEIEHVLLKHGEILEAVVLAKENQNREKDLVAYITAKTEQNSSDLRSYLKETLPEYMIPRYYIQLESLPLTPNGKIDKKTLPDPNGMGLSSGIEYIAPRNGTEEKLVEIWKEVLERENIGVKDDFFALGGHSLMAVKIVSRINHEFKAGVKIGNLFSASTIEELSLIIDFVMSQKNIKIKIEDLKEIQL